MPTGTIARMKKKNGYGFIAPDDSTRDVFFHAQSVVDNVYDEFNEGDKITFDVEDGPKSYRTIDRARAKYGAPSDDKSISFVPILDKYICATLETRAVLEALRSDGIAASISGERGAERLLTKLQAEWKKRPLQILEFQEALEQVELHSAIEGSNSAAQSRFELSTVTEISQHLIEQLRKDPSGLYEMHPRKFEELVAYFFNEEGYMATMTGRGADGGKDILVSRNDGFTSTLFLVECKRYAADRAVDVNAVKKLYATMQGDRCNGGVLVTTAKRFTKPAMDFSGKVNNNHHVTLLDLKPFDSLLKWIIGTN